MDSRVSSEFFIKVAIPRPLWHSYTYRHSSPLQPGVRVRVPFGTSEEIGVVLSTEGMQPPDDGASQVDKAWAQELKQATGQETEMTNQTIVSDASSHGIERLTLGAKASITPGTVQSIRRKKIVIKKIKEVVDESPAYSLELLSLGSWISEYYLHPLGEVLRTMLPSSTMRRKKTLVIFTNEDQDKISGLGFDGHDLEVLKRIFSKKQSCSLEVLHKNLSKHSIGFEKVSEWVKNGYIKLVHEDQAKGRSHDNKKLKKTSAHPSVDLDDVSAEIKEAPRALTALQKTVFDSIQARWEQEDYRATLLFGVTGSGKTEVYLQLIANQNRQALVLVPEIALTPQMTAVFERRFPGQIAVVHSAMSDNSRWQQLSSIRTSKARILIGPRSAVFANFSDLGLIIVDEEHDSSYKQTTGLCYQGRDVAVVRARRLNIPILLGSATPSMESWHNAEIGKYYRERMEERVSGRALPSISLLKVESHLRRGVKVASTSEGHQNFTPASNGEPIEEIPIAEEILEEIDQNLLRGQQTIVLVNRRGYAYYLFDITSASAVQCPSCSISLTIHIRSTRLQCHYCNYKTTVKSIVDQFPTHQFAAIGYGSEKAFEILKSRFPKARIGRLDSDVAWDRQILTDTLEQFREQKIDILVGTQILAKGHDFPNVTLMVLLEIDQLLNLPDFRAAERTFQLLVQAAGRAGRHQLAGKVMVQTTKGLNPVLEAGLHHDFPKFVLGELGFRRAFSYPPYSRMIAIEINSSDKTDLNHLSIQLGNWVDEVEKKIQGVRFLGPSPPAIETIRGRHRRTLILMGANAPQLNYIARKILHDFIDLKGDLRLKVDVDPNALL